MSTPPPLLSSFYFARVTDPLVRTQGLDARAVGHHHIALRKSPLSRGLRRRYPHEVSLDRHRDRD